MPRVKPVASLSGLVETDMEDDTLNAEANAFPTPDSNQENAGPTKKKAGRGKASTKKFTRPKVAARRTSGDSAVLKKAGPRKKADTKRAPLKEGTNVQAEDTEEVDEFDAQGSRDAAMEGKAPVKKPGRPPGRPAKKDSVKQSNTMEKDGEFEYTPTITRQTKTSNTAPLANTQKSTAGKRQASVEPQQNEKIVPETQVPMDIDTSEIVGEEDEDENVVPQSVFRRTNNARNSSRQRQPIYPRNRASSTSDTEKGGNDPATKRKLGEMTKKFENMESKYRSLKEIGIKEAEANLEAYRTTSEAKAKGKLRL